MSQYDQLEPKAVWQIFGAMSAIPRGSGNETAVMKMLAAWAKEHGLAVKQDQVGNLLISIPATPGHEKAAPILLQGHADMVCVKDEGSKHDFEKDPIRMIVDGDFVRADGTTLGADNGIGVALSLAVAIDPSVVHGPVEVLVTVDEERGLTGAAGVKPGFFTARKMINLDSEEDHAICIGCAGGRDTVFNLLPTQARAPKDSTARKLTVTGLLGGHSGVEIHRNRGNAIKILARLLHAALAEMDVRVVAVDGGSVRNAIPAEAVATVVIPAAKGRLFKQRVDALAAKIKAELEGIDDGFMIKVSTVQAARCFSRDASRNLLNLMAAIPSGVLGMSPTVDKLVETSSNLGVAKTDGAKVQLVSCSRSSVMSTLDALVLQHRALGELAGVEVVQPEGYPGWKPNLSSELLAVTRRKYIDTFAKEPELLAMHAGLECGLLTEKYPGLDMVSFGPNLFDVHSPKEKVSISSLQRIWKLLKGVLEDVA
ncbi:MAG: aminoacyl-histidine dipeptidase [Candidatus Krumholzibacteriia bacterium]